VKRPGLDRFLRVLSQYYEIVLFTSSPYGNVETTLSQLDKGFFSHFLFRNSTKWHRGHHVKDLSALNRDLRRVIVIDDDSKATALQPGNAIHVSPFHNKKEEGDRDLVKLLPFLQALAEKGDVDLRDELKSYEGKDIPTEFATEMAAVVEKKAEEKKRGIGGAIRSRTTKAATPAEAKHRIVLPTAAGVSMAAQPKTFEEQQTAMSHAEALAVAEWKARHPPAKEWRHKKGSASWVDDASAPDAHARLAAKGTKSLWKRMHEGNKEMEVRVRALG
jgi:Dullard-like phosphatase family protein